MTTRLTAVVQPAAHREASTLLRAPTPGKFVPAVARGDRVFAGKPLGHLIVLGRSSLVIAGDAVGIVTEVSDGAVGYGDLLVALERGGYDSVGEATTTATSAPPAAADRVFRAPTSGRFYGRPAPDKPPFVAAGDPLAVGTTICLLEVMKTFHRVTYSGDPARVRNVLVRDGDDVNAGDSLLALDDA